jgi:hypothetical protein
MKFSVSGKEYEAGPELQVAINELEATAQANQDKAYREEARADHHQCRSRRTPRSL